MAYSKDYREQVMKYIGKGHTIQEAHEVFGVGTATIKVWKRLQRETGTLDKREINRNPKKICPEKLRAYIAENPDSYLHETAEVFHCTKQAIHYAFKRLKITRKKNSVLCGKQPPT